MRTRPEVRSFDYVNHPYERVRDALEQDALAIFRSATNAAAARARDVASELRVNLGAVEVTAEIDIAVHEIEELAQAPGANRGTRIRLSWQGAERPGLFPLMNAELSVYPLTSTETQLDFEGRYEPPLGALGRALDAIVGHRLAEATTHRFVSDVARYLRETLRTEPA